MGYPVSDPRLGMTLGGNAAVQTAILIVGMGILAVIAYGDVRTRRIPNVLSLAIAILGLLRIILVHDPVAAGHTFAAATAIFVAAFLLFWYGAIGGGDAKLVAATALLVGYHDLSGFLFLMSACGGALALAVLAHDTLRPRLWLTLRWARMPSATETAGCIAEPARPTVPYGVAIAAAGVVTLILNAPFAR
jgi:prepilin peptidase CpaA